MSYDAMFVWVLVSFAIMVVTVFLAAPLVWDRRWSVLTWRFWNMDLFLALGLLPMCWAWGFTVGGVLTSLGALLAVFFLVRQAVRAFR